MFYIFLHCLFELSLNKNKYTTFVLLIHLFLKYNIYYINFFCFKGANNNNNNIKKKKTKPKNKKKMTTNYRGPESTIVEYPSHRIGCSAHSKYMDFQTNQPDKKVAIPIKNITEEMHDIGAFQIVVMPDSASSKAQGFAPLPGDSKTYGKTPVIAQVGNVPHGIPDWFFDTSVAKDLKTKADGESVIDDMKRAMVGRNISFVGVSLDSYRKAQGPDHTPEQDGLAVLMHGPVTCKFFTQQPLRPMADLVLSVIPRQMEGRAGGIRYQSDGPEKYPLTVKEYSFDTFEKAVRMVLMQYLAKLEMGVIHFNISSSSSNNKQALGSSTDDQNAALIVAGIIGLTMNDKGYDGFSAMSKTIYNSRIQLLLSGLQGIDAEYNRIIGKNIQAVTETSFRNTKSGMIDYDWFVKS